MKLIRSFSILLMSMMSLFCSIAAAQDLATTRPRRVPDVGQQRQSNEDATKLAYNGKASGAESDVKVAVPWVVLKKAEPHSESRPTNLRPTSLRRPAQDPTPQPTIDETPEGFTVSGKAPDGKTLKLYVNDVERTDTKPTETVSRAGVYTFRLTKDPLKCKDKVQVSYDDANGNAISSEPTTVVCTGRSDERSTRRDSSIRSRDVSAGRTVLAGRPIRRLCDRIHGPAAQEGLL